MQVYCTVFWITKLDDINAKPKLFSRKFYNPPLDLKLWLTSKSIKTVDVFFMKENLAKPKEGAQ